MTATQTSWLVKFELNYVGLIMKNKTQKILSLMLVLAFVTVCFVTAFTSTTNAAELPPDITVPSTVRTLVNTNLKNLDDEFLSTFAVNAVSGNGLNGPVIVWWYHFPDAPTGNVYMLVASQSAGKIATAARLGTAEGTILGGVDKKDANNIAYTMLKFTNVWLIGNELVHINMGNGWNTGQAIIGKVNEYFPQLVTVTYFDGGIFYHGPEYTLGYSDPVVSGSAITIADITKLPRYLPHTGYTFTGWATSVNGGVVYSPGDPLIVNEDTNLYAVWIPIPVSYVVNYLEQGTDLVLADQKSGAGFFGNDVTEVAIWIEGFTAVPPDTVTVPLAVSDNVINFYYSRDAADYVVNYLEQGTDLVLAAQKSGAGFFGKTVTENAIDIEGYEAVVPISVTITIDVTGNVINFYYVKNVDELVMTGINWNNGNANGNGDGINQFSVNGVTLKNNKNYMTSADFDTAVQKTPVKNDATALYTVDERTVLCSNGSYVKVYDVRVALFVANAGTWKIYGGTIEVDNPGGNNANQTVILSLISPIP
ncbi:MAG: InlB B-repeat-containing protein [Nitrososphaerota archaeon]|nr:InlB B-repeat-containing protein [Nitrososphaerota archaeon]